MNDPECTSIELLSYFKLKMEGFDKWHENYMTKLTSSCDYTSNPPHIMWTGPLKHYTKKDITYGRFYYTDMSGGYKDVHAHAALYMFSNKYKELTPKYMTYGGSVQQMHVSHRCHLNLCVKNEHLSYEPQIINNNRISCKKNKVCSGHDEYEPCIF